jgi:16S rRNA (guanine(966)-N(2))-methyltransferase RsmD
LRVIAGTAKGRRLLSPRGSRIRPTSDRVKEAVFSIIAAAGVTFPQCAVLDIFAGTGNLGIESLSRGASGAVFVDNHRESVDLIRKNLDLTGFRDRGSVIAKDAVTALKTLEESGRRFGIIFIDPPYHHQLQEKVLEFLSTSSLLDQDSLVIVEHSSREDMPGAFGPLGKFDSRTYGDTAVTFYTLTDRDQP